LATRPNRAAPQRPNDLYVTSRSPADVPRTSGASYPTRSQSIQEKKRKQGLLFYPQLMLSLSSKVSTAPDWRSRSDQESSQKQAVSRQLGCPHHGSASAHFLNDVHLIN
jgi:hypothetical protein